MLLYLMFALPGLLLALYAQNRVESNFRKYAQVRTVRGVTGAQVARYLLDSQGLEGVRIERARGYLTDHYDPRTKVLRLSDAVYNSNSVAAAGIAAHEMGHALQHAESYALLNLRGSMVSSVKVGSLFGPGLFILGLLINPTIALVGLIIFSITVLFALVTLPVEFDASRRAKKLLVSQNVLAQEELKGVKSVLDAAALTYVAAALQSIGTLFYYATFLRD